MQNFLRLLILFSIIFSCKNNDEKKAISEVLQEEKTNLPYANVILYDDFDNELILDTVSVRREAQFSPVYIGEIKDFIKVVYNTSKIEQRTWDREKYRWVNETDLKIYIDTTKVFGFSMNHFKDSENEHRVNTKSYPVFIKNETSDTLKVGVGDIFPIVTEAQDTTGKWNAIESHFMYACGVGLTEFYLPPNHIIITPLRQNIKMNTTKYRVKYALTRENQIYSNEIGGNIGFE